MDPLMNSTAVKPPPPKVWRARLLPDELDAAGFNAEGADGWAIIKGLLRLKGLPEIEGRNIRTKLDKRDGALTIEFKE